MKDLAQILGVSIPTVSRSLKNSPEISREPVSYTHLDVYKRQHKSYVNFGQTFKNGFTYEINAFQNYSDNDYQVDAPAEDFETGRIDKDKRVRVKLSLIHIYRPKPVPYRFGLL